MVAKPERGNDHVQARRQRFQVRIEPPLISSRGINQLLRRGQVGGCLGEDPDPIAFQPLEQLAFRINGPNVAGHHPLPFSLEVCDGAQGLPMVPGSDLDRIDPHRQSESGRDHELARLQQRIAAERVAEDQLRRVAVPPVSTVTARPHVDHTVARRYRVNGLDALERAPLK